MTHMTYLAWCSFQFTPTIVRGWWTTWWLGLPLLVWRWRITVIYCRTAMRMIGMILARSAICWQRYDEIVIKSLILDVSETCTHTSGSTTCGRRSDLCDALRLFPSKDFENILTEELTKSYSKVTLSGHNWTMRHSNLEGGDQLFYIKFQLHNCT